MHYHRNMATTLISTLKKRYVTNGSDDHFYHYYFRPLNAQSAIPDVFDCTLTPLRLIGSIVSFFAFGG